MDRDIFTDETIRILRRHLRLYRNREARPILVFSCGGDEEKHHSRRLLKEYVEYSDLPSLRNVFFLKAENIAVDPCMRNFDLLTQEALVADIADWLVIFAESVGSFCELGAFAALPHAAAITSVVVDRCHKDDSSFLMNGPVRVIEQTKSPLSEVFFANLSCPMESHKFSNYVGRIREKVRQSEDERTFSPIRKPINLEPTRVLVGSFAHELLDLVSLFGPMGESELMEFYCRLKGFSRGDVQFVSQILDADMCKKPRISISQIVATMLSTGVLGRIEDDRDGLPLYYSKIPLENYFMFKGVLDDDFRGARAQVILRRRRRGRTYEKSLYRRFDRA